MLINIFFLYFRYFLIFPFIIISLSILRIIFLLFHRLGSLWCRSLRGPYPFVSLLWLTLESKPFCNIRYCCYIIKKLYYKQLWSFRNGTGLYVTEKKTYTLRTSLILRLINGWDEGRWREREMRRGEEGRGEGVPDYGGNQSLWRQAGHRWSPTQTDSPENELANPDTLLPDLTRPHDPLSHANNTKRKSKRHVTMIYLMKLWLSYDPQKGINWEMQSYYSQILLAPINRLYVLTIKEEGQKAPNSDYFTSQGSRGEWTKKSGSATVSPYQPRLPTFTWGQKATNSDGFTSHR